MRRARFQPVDVEHDSESERHRIVTGSTRITLRGAPAGLIEDLFRRESFTIREAAAWAPGFDLYEDIIPLLRTLTEEGILLEDAPQPS